MAVFWSPGTRIDYGNLSFNTGNQVGWVCTGVTGLGSPAPRMETGARINAHGSWATKAYLTPRVFELSGSYHGSSAADGDAAVSTLINACSLEDKPITFHLASGAVTANVRRNGDVKYDRVKPGWHRWNVSVIAHDPFLYLESAQQTFTAGLPNVTGGLTLPALVPWFLNSSSTGGEASYYNNYSNGSYSIRIDGAIATPRLVHITADRSYTLRWDLTLAPGEWLDIYPTERVALLNGVSTRSPSVREWSAVASGNNTWRLRADSYNASARATIRIQPAL